MPKGNNSKHAGRRTPAAGSAIYKPPQMEANPQLTKKYRFISTSATPTAITTAKILNACGVLATGATTSADIFGAVKIVKIKAWAPPAAQGSATTVSLLWASSITQFTSGLEITDSSNSVTVPALIRCTPPRSTLSSFFTTATNSVTLFTLTAPVGTVIDLTVRLVMNDGTTVDSPGTSVLTGATTGLTYFTPLDGHGGVYTPVGLTIG